MAPEPRGTGGAGSSTKDTPSTSISTAPFLRQTFTPTAARVSTLTEHVSTLGAFLPSLVTKRNGFSQHEEWGGRAWSSHPVSKSNCSCCVCVCGGGWHSLGCMPILFPLTLERSERAVNALFNGPVGVREEEFPKGQSPGAAAPRRTKEY